MSDGGAVYDPTVASEELRAQVEAAAGVRLDAMSPAFIADFKDNARKEGNRMFKKKMFQQAAEMYSAAIAADGKDANMFSNRSAAYLAMNRLDEAYEDAAKCIRLNAAFAKGYYRLGVVLMARGENRDAVVAFQQGLGVDGTNQDLQRKLDEALRLFNKDRRRYARELTSARKDLVLALREARRQELQLLMRNQYKQSMTSPDWDIEDYDWRPTFLPRLRQTAVNTKFTDKHKPHLKALASYVRALGELETPKPCLSSYVDVARIQGYTAALTKLLAARPGAHVLAIGNGGATLALACASAASFAAYDTSTPPAMTSVVERSRILYRMAKQVLRANKSHRLEVAPGTSVPLGNFVTLVDRPLHRVRSSDDDPVPDNDDDDGNDPDDDGYSTLAHGPADVLVTDAFDALVLGARVVPMVRDAAKRKLCRLGCRIIPAKVRVYAVASSMRVGTISGLDLSSLNVYRWHPSLEACRLNAETTPRRDLTAPFLLCEIDLQRILDMERAAADSSEGNSATAPAIPPNKRTAPAEFVHDAVVSPAATAAGKCNALCVFFVLDFAGDGSRCATNWRRGKQLLHEAGHERSDPHLGVLDSIAQSVHYLDEFDVRRVGDTIPIRVQHDGSMLVLSHASLPSVRPRHAYIPKWHYDMLFDSQRNDAYEAALRRAIADTRSAKGLKPLIPPSSADADADADDPRDESWEAVARRAIRMGRAPPPPPSRIAGWATSKHASEEVLVLDVGAGTGILSMLAARHGADKVVGCEQSVHMCDVGEECEVLNGYAGQCLLLNKDVRRMLCKDDPMLEKSGGVKPDGTAPELERRADVLVYEVFDSGLIGEGALHLVHHARSRLLTPDARLVPMGATVYAQPICMRTTACRTSHPASGRTERFDVSCANRYRWRPDYEGVELGAADGEPWIALAEPTEVFTFDFYESELNMQPLERVITFDVDPGAAEQIGRAKAKLARRMREERREAAEGDEEAKAESLPPPSPPRPPRPPPSQKDRLDDCDTDEDEDEGEGQVHEHDAGGGHPHGGVAPEDADFEAGVRAAVSRLPPDELDGGPDAPPLVCNAIAFWFDLHMDASTMLTTSPYAATEGNRKGPTWQQAVQYVEERKVSVGEALEVTAKHDTYGISFGLRGGAAVGNGDTGVPLFDAAWDVSRQRMESMNDSLARTVVQSPLEFRRASAAAVELAARPQDFGLDAGHAARFCQRMLS